MASSIKIDNETDVQELTKAHLVNKGVDEESAEYLARLFAESQKGKDLVNAGEIVPLGNCSLLGISPG
ncbi:hypothetical protein IWQ51_004778 [Labrenzia sp. EL_142]|nr:hypothetical protein [Labrenzia sp. EL_142]